jgi:hypothetical protein
LDGDWRISPYLQPQSEPRQAAPEAVPAPAAKVEQQYPGLVMGTRPSDAGAPSGKIEGDTNNDGKEKRRRIHL